MPGALLGADIDVAGGTLEASLTLAYTAEACAVTRAIRGASIRVGEYVTCLARVIVKAIAFSGNARSMARAILYTASL